MTKQEFLAQLQSGLSGLPQKDVEERLSFYSEIIDDKMEEGVAEEVAVAGIGPLDEIVSQTVADTPLAKLVKEKIKPKRALRAWEILLLVLGSPLWLPLSIAAFAVLLSVYAVVWALLISLWAVEVSLAACAVSGVACGAFYVIVGGGSAGLALLGAGIFFSGLSVFLFFGCTGATRGVVRLTKKIALGVKSLFIKKEDAR